VTKKNKYLEILSKINTNNQINFVCIDRRIKENNKTFIILDNGQKIILPETVTKVPALLLLNNNYKVLFGEQIFEYLKPKREMELRVATQNNMEPMAFSLAGGGFGSGSIVSDQYSFLDQGDEDLKASGNGGLRQMHNYVDLNTAFKGEISGDLSNQNNNNTNTTIRGSQKMGEDAMNSIMEERIKKMKEERDADLRSMTGNRPLGF
jgi:hypothetical protein